MHHSYEKSFASVFDCMLYDEHVQKSICDNCIVSHQLGVNKYLIQATDRPIQEKRVPNICDFLFEIGTCPILKSVKYNCHI